MGPLLCIYTCYMAFKALNKLKNYVKQHVGLTEKEETDREGEKREKDRDKKERERERKEKDKEKKDKDKKERDRERKDKDKKDKEKKDKTTRKLWKWRSREANGDEFHEGLILPPVLIQLKKILEQYPDDSQILKELIQNAEDAGASNIKFLHDRRTYGTNPRGLHHPKLAQYQGPALCAQWDKPLDEVGLFRFHHLLIPPEILDNDEYGPALYAFNNALFEEDDWKGIRMLSQSVKQQDPFKVGYFGMGFKSVFHLTDMPSILSGERLGMIDPHQKVFSNTTFSWNISKQQDLLRSKQDQFDPYIGTFECTRDTFTREGFYNGTLFRFPLRRQASALSDNIYNPERLQRLFESFEDDAHLTLLFLRHLESVELYERDERTVRPKFLFRVQISDSCLEDVKEKRKDFLQRVKNGRWMDKAIVATYPVTIETVKKEKTGEVHKTYTWLVTNYYSGGRASAIFRKLHQDIDLSFPPWVGVAMPVDVKGTSELNEEDGHVFCFLPLPPDRAVPTGLPVHINGFFALEQNRKYIKWPNVRQRRDDLMDKHLLWNQCLIQEALPYAYAHLLLTAIDYHRDGFKLGITVDLVYRAFPDFNQVDRRWEGMLVPLYSELMKHKIVFSSVDGGHWLEPKSAIFNTLEENEATKEVILQVLALNQAHVANVPTHVLYAIRSCCHVNINKITPVMVSAALRKIQDKASFTWDEKMALLKFLLKQNKYELLDGLLLLPLANGGFTTFHANPRRAEKFIFIPTNEHPQDILPNIKDDLLDAEIERETLECLTKAAMRGYTQLKVLTKDVIAQLLLQSLPAQWKGVQRVTWDPEQFGQPPKEWLQNIWMYLQRNFTRDLSAFEPLPLIPIPEGEQTDLVQLYATCGVIMRHMDGLSLDEDVERILVKLGVNVVEDLPLFVKNHPLVTEMYVFSPSYIGVLKTMNRVCEGLGLELFLAKMTSQTTADEKRRLRSLFSKMSMFDLQLRPELQRILFQIPLLETLEGSGGIKESRFVCATEVSLAAPNETLPVNISQSLIKIDSADASNFAQLLKMRRLTVIELLREIVFPDIEGAYYAPEDIDKCMLYVLKHYYAFLEKDSSIETTLRSLPFLPRKGLLLTTERFYDPDHALLQKMFQGEENFPVGVYADQSIISILRNIGLRGLEDVETEDLYETARLIHHCGDQGSKITIGDAAVKSDALMEYLVLYPKSLFQDCNNAILKDAIAELCWVRPMNTRPSFYPENLKWCESKKAFEKAVLLKNLHYASIVGSVLHIVPVEPGSELGEVYGWNEPPELKCIVEHMHHVVSSYEPSQKAKFMDLATKVYDELSKYDAPVILEAFTKARIVNWLWHGEGFTAPGNVVINTPFMDLRPWVYSIPNEISSHAQLFRNCGVKESCEIVDVLMMIKKHYEKEPQTDQKFTKRDLHICVSILNELKSHVTEEELIELENVLVLPILTKNENTIKMASLPNCTFCDSEWLRQGYDLADLMSEDEEILLVHPNVPTSTSEALGVPTLMSRMLDADELDFSFGQSDSLTHRLNTLLQEYTDGFAVPKELVQNADDAGATEVRFLYDERENEDAQSCLIDEGMRECQGPALWAFNDAVFTDDDFENITKLSGATKEMKTEMIGRFGLGFNAVYNITDVPSFISRHNIVIFDPHTSHLGRSIKNKSRPGIKIDMRKHRRKLKRLGNQFKPFNDIFSCDLRPNTGMESFNATLFRFPLRTRNQAIRSEICQRHYDDKEMRSLLNMLFKGAEHLLLFTQNVIKVTVYHIPRGGTPANMAEVFKVTKAPLKIIRELGVDISLSPSAQRMDPKVKEFIRQCNILKASKEALQYVKSGTPVDHLIVPSTSMILNLSCKMSRASEKIFGCSEYDQNRPWIVTSHFGTGKALRMALQEENMLPIGGVAVPLRFTGKEDMYIPEPITQVEDAEAHHGTIFAYLPMPIHSGLPVHINGSFTVTSNRRHLCERNEDDKFDLRAIWNEALLHDSVCRAYLIMLQDLSSFLEPKSYISLWPDACYVQSNVNELFVNFYKTLSTETEGTPFALYSDGQRWGRLMDAVFLTPELRTSSVGDIIMKIFSTHMCESNKILVDLPVKIKRSFQAAKCDKALDERSYDLARFLEAQLLPNILQVKEELRDPVVLYSLRNGTDEIKALLKEHPCIPVTPGGDLRMPGALIDPSSELAALYSAEDARFPHGNRTYASKEILPLLTELGMARDDIPWEDLLERAKSIRKVEYPIARRRVYNLLYFLEQKLSKMKASKIEVEEYFREQFLQTPFLPIMSKPKNFSKKWKGQDFEEEALLTSSELYPARCMPLVCCVHPILDESVLPSAVNNVREFLQLSNKYVSLSDVLEQINTIIYTGNETTDREILAELQRVSYVIYDFLEDLVKKDKNSQARIRDDLSSKPFLFVQNAFLQPKHLAMNFSHPCVPYLFSVPEHMKQHYPNLLQAIGVRDHFDPRDYVEALQVMHEQYQNNPLDKDTVRLALRLVNYLNDSISDHNQTLDDVLREFGEIYIPDAESVLRAATELCYNEPECQWLPTDQVTKLSHPLIPYAISKQLGVNTRRQEVLKKHSRGIPFGQRECLTNRLKRILASYPCDKEILKELLQNADDAGSADIHFIKDPRYHPIERVFEESWRPLQGPSLCVYNDTVFTEEDIEGIQRLGEGSKSNDPNKTGQYGVGFNCVYHLTDAPSFMTAVPGSGQNLCIFDPHAKYVPGSTPEVPGRRYDDVLELRTIFTDVFSCYLGDKFDLNSATMFRFPLRTQEMARDSELSETAFTLENLTTLLSKFKQEIFDCLLFVNSVKTVSISDIDKVTNRLTNTYTVTSEITNDDQDKRYAFHQALKEMSEKLKEGEKGVFDMMAKEVSYTLKLQDNRGYWEKWLVVQRLGFEDGTVLPPSLYDAFRNKELALLPRGGVAAMLDASDMKRADRYKRAFCFLPLPLRTDLPVQINGHFALEHEARRNLWLDEESGYKTDWNMMIIKKVIARAYVTLLKNIPSHLGTLRVGEDTSFFSVCDDRVPDIDFYSSLFPKFNTTYPYWKALTKDVYRLIDSTKSEVLPVLKLQPMTVVAEKGMDESAFMNEDWSEVEVEWCSTGRGAIKPYFDNLDETFVDQQEMNSTSFLARSSRMSSTPKKKPRKEILRRILLRCGLKVIQLPMDIYENFRKATVSVEVISPSAVLAFFKTFNLPTTTCNVGSLPVAITNTQFRTEKILEVVMQYCATDKNYFLAQLEGLPFELCEDDQLRVFSVEDPLYLSTFHGLLPDCGAMFVHHSLVQSIFSDIDPEQYTVFMRLDIPALAGLLSNVIRDSLFKNGKAHLPWSYAQSGIPNKKWIKIFWSYIKTEVNRLMELNEVGDLAVMDMLRKFLRPLSDWCFIPAFIPPAGSKHNTSRSLYDSLEREPDEQYLVPIGMADTVIDFTYTSIMSAGVREALRSLGIPELHARMLDGITSLSSSSANNSAAGNLPKNVVYNNNSDLVRKLVASLENPVGVLRVLDYTIRAKHGVVALTSEDSHSILKYFNDSVDGWVSNEDAIKILRKLPLFLTVKGDVINLGEKKVYILPSDVPTNDMNLWEKEEGIVFLRKNKTLSRLHSALNCEALTTTEIYTNFIFKSFHLLNPPARVAHLQFLKDIKLNQLQGDEKDQLITGLKTLEFLEDARGILRPASHYYDPYQPVFKVLLAASPSAFPPPPFREFKWLDFMRLIGLKHKVTTDMFVEFAQDISKEAVTVQTEATFNKARTLLTQLFKRENLATELSKGLLEKIADIPFIPAVKVSVMLQNIYPQHGCEGAQKTYIQFRNSVPEDKEHLCWSSSHLIPDWANPYKLTLNDVTIKYDTSNPLSNFKEYKHKICSQLGVLEEPTIDKVIEHMRHICLEQPRIQEDDVKAFMKIEVMKKIYKFLQQYATDDDYAANALKDTPCVMVDTGHLMVTPGQVVMNLFEEDQIFPYLYKAPTELGEFKKLFTYLGASLNATVDQYAMVLSNIYHATRGQKMHPNEMMAAFKCVQGLFNTLEKHPNDEVNESVLYLPSKFGTLLDAKDLVFNDDPSFTDRIKTFNRPFLVDLFECGVHASSFDDLIKLLPSHLQPVMLTSLVKEVLEEESRETLVQHGIAEKLRMQLNSVAFSQGVVRLIRHENRRSGQKVGSDVMNSIQSRLKKIKVYGVKCVKTYLSYEDELIPHSDMECECFVDQTQDDEEGEDGSKELTWNIYIDSSAAQSEELLVSVAEVVNRIVGGYLRNSVHYLQPILSTQPHSVAKVLDRLKIRPDHLYSSGTDFKAPTLPHPGSFIPIEDHHLLKQDFEDFEPGEYVGYELDDNLSGSPTVIYAIILDRILEEMSRGDEIVFKRKYQINAGDDRKPVTALATDLYKFHRLDEGVMTSDKKEQKKPKDQKQSTFQSGVGSGFTSAQKRPSRAERFFSRRSGGFDSARRRFASPGGSSMTRDEEDVGSQDRSGRQTPLSPERKPEPKKETPKKAEPKKAEPKKAEPKKAEPKKAEPKKEEPKKAQPKTQPTRPTTTKPEKKEEKTPEEPPKEELKPEPPRFFTKREGFKYSRPQSPRMEHKTYARSSTPDNRPETPDSRPGTPEDTPPPRRRRHGYTIPEEPEVEDLGPDVEDGKKSAYDYIRASRTKPGAESSGGTRIGPFSRFSTRRKMNQTRSRTPESDKPTDRGGRERPRSADWSEAVPDDGSAPPPERPASAAAGETPDVKKDPDYIRRLAQERAKKWWWGGDRPESAPPDYERNYDSTHYNTTPPEESSGYSDIPKTEKPQESQSSYRDSFKPQTGPSSTGYSGTGPSNTGPSGPAPSGAGFSDYTNSSSYTGYTEANPGSSSYTEAPPGSSSYTGATPGSSSYTGATPGSSSYTGATPGSSSSAGAGMGNGTGQNSSYQEAGGYKSRFFGSSSKPSSTSDSTPLNEPKFPDPKSTGKTQEEIMDEISDALEEAWKLPEQQRKKIIKRILLKWHPDKNIGNEQFATEITQHIQYDIARLEQGLPRGGATTAGSGFFSSGNPFAGSSEFQKNFQNAYQYFYEQMNNRAKEHKKNRERYQDNFSKTKDDFKSSKFNVPPSFSKTNPQPTQAFQFFRQAQEDLKSADNDYNGREPAFEWVCMKAHQAAEKSLKAAQFMVDAVSSFSHDLPTLAATMDDNTIRTLAIRLQSIVGDANKFYNPDPIDFVIIPHEEFTREKALNASIIATEILEKVRIMMGIEKNP